MTISSSFRHFLAVAVLCLFPALAPALVNPSLQPKDIAERHRCIVSGSIGAIDDQVRTVVIGNLTVITGQLPLTQVVVTMPKLEGQSGSDPFNRVEADGEVVLYLGKNRAGKEDEGLLYYRDEWHEITARDLATGQWELTRSLGDAMTGTFNGDAGRLAEMMADAKAGRAFFPAQPFARFQAESILGTWADGLNGVAVADLNGDGRLDVLAAGTAGCHAFVQGTNQLFSERTAELGLARSATSVSAADADGDGDVDLLIDGALLTGSPTGFATSPRLPALIGVKMACFAELDGDGWPDVLVSRSGKGLSAWRNPGTTGDFVEITAPLGLDQPENGAGLDGFVALGDWDADGRTDLFYSAGKGYLLVRDAARTFKRTKLATELSFKLSDGSGRTGQTGGSTFAGLWSASSSDLVIPGETGLTIFNNHDGVGIDRAGAGNESHLTRSSQFAVLTEDLNLDGNIDLLTLTRGASSRNAFHTNRGYGSYMMDDLYSQDDLFPGNAYNVGHRGAVAADLDGDGAPDLVLTGVDGALRVLRNDVLNHRRAAEDANAQQRALASTAILAVEVAPGLGVVGARITARYADGRIAGWRRLGDQVLTGCGPSHQARIAVREAGPVTVEVVWSDGKQQSVQLTQAAGTVTRVPFTRAR